MNWAAGATTDDEGAVAGGGIVRRANAKRALEKVNRRASRACRDRCCRSGGAATLSIWAVVGLFLLLPGVPAKAQSGPLDENVRARLMADVPVNVLDLRMQTLQLPPQQRYERLLDAVIPEPGLPLRIDIDFAPTNPAPPVAQRLGLTGGRESVKDQTERALQGVGGDLLSPALDLVEAAQQAARLDELRQMLTQRAVPAGAAAKPHLALRILIAIARHDLDDASETLNDFRELVAQSPVLEAERGPEAVVIWTAARQPRTRDAARELAFLVYEQARNGAGPRSERWHRHVYSLKHCLQWMADSSGRQQQTMSADRPVTRWKPACRMTAESCGQGFPTASWVIEPGQAEHVTSHDHDYLYYVVPLEGDFQLEDWPGGRWATPSAVGPDRS